MLETSNPAGVSVSADVLEVDDDEDEMPISVVLSKRKAVQTPSVETAVKPAKKRRLVKTYQKKLKAVLQDEE